MRQVRDDLDKPFEPLGGGGWGGGVCVLGLGQVRDDLDLSNFDRSLTTDQTWKTSDLLRGDSCAAIEDLVRAPHPPAPFPHRPARPPPPPSYHSLHHQHPAPPHRSGPHRPPPRAR